MMIRRVVRMQTYEIDLDKNQREVYKAFPENHPLHNVAALRRFIEWVTFWRRNVLLFARDFIGMTLYPYQQVWLWYMWRCSTTIIVAARSDAKTYMLAVYSMLRCYLYPGTMIRLASVVKGQAKKIITDKIERELMGRYPKLAAAVKKVNTNNNDLSVEFFNGSSIVVVVANDNARSDRSTTNGYEEARMIAKKVIDRVLAPFLILRQPPYLAREEYKNLGEEPKEIYISSSWYDDSWMWDVYDDAYSAMLRGENKAALALDFAVAIHHNIKPMSFIREQKRKLDDISWRMEYLNLRIREGTDSYFTHALVTKNQKLKNPFFPRRAKDGRKNPFALERMPGEIRIVSCDMAFTGGRENDNSIFSCIRALPERRSYIAYGENGSRHETGDFYRRVVPYLESINGGDIAMQAVRIKQLFEDFDADYLILDLRNAGIGVYDLLIKVLYDEERQKEYPPWGCMNDDKIKDTHPTAPGAPQIIYTINATAKLNSDIAIDFRGVLSDERIDFLIDFEDALDEILMKIPDYRDAMNSDDQVFFETPFYETKALVGETVGLVYEKDAQTGRIRIEERPGERKDRYTSVSYGSYFITLLEQGLSTGNEEYEFMAFYN